MFQSFLSSGIMTNNMGEVSVEQGVCKALPYKLGQRDHKCVKILTGYRKKAGGCSNSSVGTDENQEVWSTY